MNKLIELYLKLFFWEISCISIIFFRCQSSCAIIGEGSAVTSDVPPWTIVAGNPARIIRQLSEDER